MLRGRATQRHRRTPLRYLPWLTLRYLPWLTNSGPRPLQLRRRLYFGLWAGRDFGRRFRRRRGKRVELQRRVRK